MRIALAFFCATLMVAGIAAQIEADRRHPVFGNGGTDPFSLTGRGVGGVLVSGWPTTTYDLVRIGGWALLIFGALIVALALIREFRTAS